MFVALLFLLLFLSVPASGEKVLRGYPILKIYSPTPPERFLTLTFDDGPRPWILPEILDFLKKENIKATFFVQGWQAEANPVLIARTHEEDHEIGNHTYGHVSIPEFVKKKGKRWVVNSDIERASRILQNITGQRPRFFRPRSWLISELYKETTDCQRFFHPQRGYVFPERTLYKEELGCKWGYIVQVLDDPRLPPYLRTLRDVNTLDYEFHEQYKKKPSQATKVLVTVIKKVLAEREKKGIYIHVLTFHELPVSLDVLKALVPYWRSQGYRFVTLRKVYGL